MPATRRRHFRSARKLGSGGYQSRYWHAVARYVAPETFPPKRDDGLKNRGVGSLRTRLEPINIDKVGGWERQKVQGQPGDIAVGGDGSVWGLGKYTAGGNGPVYYWDPTTSTWKTPRAGGRRAHRRRRRRRRVGRELRRNSYCARPQQVAQ